MPHPAKLTLFSFMLIMKRFYLTYFEILLPMVQLWSYLDIVSFIGGAHAQRTLRTLSWDVVLGRILANFFMKWINTCDVSFGAESSAMSKS